MNKKDQTSPLWKFMERHFLKVCPKSGRCVGIRAKAWWFFPVSGIPALVWFLLRVLPKPSRLNYPCQQVAAPIAGSFLLWLVGISGAAVAFRNARVHLRKKSYAIALGSLAIGACWLVFNASMHSTNSNAAVTAPLVWPPAGESPNNPIGTAGGLFPGRVVWVRDTTSIVWNGPGTNYWWDDAHTKQAVVKKMFSKMLRSYTGTTDDAQAWNALFRHYNSSHNRGDKAYTIGEKIVIKVNANHDKTSYTWDNEVHPNPAVVHALVSQLILVVGVKGGDITVAEPSQCIGDPIYNKIRADSVINPEFKKVWFADKKMNSAAQRIKADQDTTSGLYFKLPDTSVKSTSNVLVYSITKKFYLPKCYTQATYLINLSILRGHRVFGVTMASKNHFGSIYSTDTKSFVPGVSGGKGSSNPILHNFSLWDYAVSNKIGLPHCYPNFYGHKDLGGKELVYFIDGICTSKLNENGMIRYSSLGNYWAASLFMSQDPVALESVGADIMCNEPNLTTGNQSFTADLDNSFREMALAHSPPSGVKYYPYNDNNPIKQSLGVHEHWNNTTNKKYSRNLSPAGMGIELLGPDSVSLVTSAQNSTGALKNMTSTRIESLRFESGKIALAYTLYKAGSVAYEVLDVRGRMLQKSITENRSAGYHSVAIDVSENHKTHGAQKMIVRLKTVDGATTQTVYGF